MLDTILMIQTRWVDGDQDKERFYYPWQLSAGHSNVEVFEILEE